VESISIDFNFIYLFIHLFISVLGIEYRGLAHIRQMLYHLSYAPRPFVFILFLRWVVGNFAQVGLQLSVLLPLPLS
jgi:hypothetical protein